jgi:hypothetical protein
LRGKFSKGACDGRGLKAVRKKDGHADLQGKDDAVVDTGEQKSGGSVMKVSSTHLWQSPQCVARCRHHG